MRTALASLAVAGAVAAATAACGGDPSSGDGRLQVVAAFYPLQFVTEHVGGDLVSVTALTPPGVEAHDLELTPSQVAGIAEADLVVYLSGFQPAVDAAVEAHARRPLDVTEVVPLIGTGPGGDRDADHDAENDADQDSAPADPHLWLDPERLATIADEVAAALSALDPGRTAGFAGGASELRQRLASLDTEYANGLTDCRRRELVVSHAAFGYLAERYDLRQVAITGLSPEQEPTPQRLAEVIRTAEEHGATTIFFEVLVSPDVARLIAEHLGARTAVLDPIEGLAPGSEDDYFSLMRANLDQLRDALACP